jgi:hypothetical protein
MTRIALLVLMALTPALVEAQQREGRRGGGPPDSARAAELRGQIEERFAERVKSELNLSDEQTAKLKATHERFAERHRPVMQRQRAMRRALHEQMRPGVAANQDSVRKLLEGTRAARAELLKIETDEARELGGYLTPVQQAQYQMMRDRFMRRVRDVHRGRRGDGPPRRGGGEPRPDRQSAPK